MQDVTATATGVTELSLKNLAYRSSTVLYSRFFISSALGLLEMILKTIVRSVLLRVQGCGKQGERAGAERLKREN